MSRYQMKEFGKRSAPSEQSELVKFLLKPLKHPMNIAGPVMPMGLRSPVQVQPAASRNPIPSVAAKSFLPKSIVRRGAPVSGRQLPIPWNNMSDANNSEGEGAAIAPEPRWNQGIEELFPPETVAKPVSGLRKRMPAWVLPAVEGMENRVKKYSNNARPGRGFRTRKGGSRYRDKIATRRRK